MSAAIEVEGLEVSFPDGRWRVSILDGVDFRVEAGEVLALVGESGCGKSMTALGCMRLIPKPGRIDRGRVLLDGRELLELPVPAMRQVRGAEISMIFQEPMTSLSPVVTVGTQVVEAIRLHEKISVSAARKRVADLFARVGIPDPAERLDAYPHQLSGGLKQRVMIAMALCTQPRVLIADEPTTALDVTIQAQILELMRELQRETGTAILLITHDLGIVNELADRVAVMYAGRIVEEATRHELFRQPRHPYTQGLLRSMPALVAPGEPLHEIAGTVPPPSDWPAGCRFVDRCPRAFDPCAGPAPDFQMLGRGHSAACHALAAEPGE